MEGLLELTASALRLGIPVAICALGALWSERCGVINIGMEGMMLTGAFWGAAGAFWYGPTAGILLAVAAGLVMALLHAAVTVSGRVDQIVSGVAINILAYGLNRFFGYRIFNMAASSPDVPGLPEISAGGATLSWIVPFAFVLAGLSWLVLTRTGFGLRLQAVGENPAAADAAGNSVPALRYVGVLLGGAFAGLAGAYLSIEHTGMYVEGMTQGKGFIALAALIVGNWNPFGLFGASLLFGLFESMSFRLVQSQTLPYQFVQMAPYLLTLAVLAGLRGKTRAPAATGQNWSRDGDE